MYIYIYIRCLFIYICSGVSGIRSSTTSRSGRRIRTILLAWLGQADLTGGAPARIGIGAPTSSVPVLRPLLIHQYKQHRACSHSGRSHHRHEQQPPTSHSLGQPPRTTTMRATAVVAFLFHALPGAHGAATTFVRVPEDLAYAEAAARCTQIGAAIASIHRAAEPADARGLDRGWAVFPVSLKMTPSSTAISSF